MVSNIALSIDTTQARTGINALLSNTGFVALTFRVCEAFRSTVWSSANHSWLATTVTSIPDYPRGIGVGSTRVRITWIYHYRFYSYKKEKKIEYMQKINKQDF